MTYDVCLAIMLYCMMLFVIHSLIQYEFYSVIIHYDIHYDAVLYSS